MTPRRPRVLGLTVGITAALTTSLFLFGCERKPVQAPRVAAGNESPRPISAPTLDLSASLSRGQDGGEVTEPPLALEHQDPGKVDHMARVEDLRMDGDSVSALREARRALYDAPDDTEVLESIAHSAQLLGRLDLVASAWERVGELEPEEVTPLVRQARALLRMRAFSDAVRVAGEAIQRDEGNPECYQTLGRAYLGARDLPKAISSFQKAVALEPEHGYALNNLGFVYLQANRNEEAVEVLTQAQKLLPHTAFVANNLGVALERVGKTDDARRAYDEAMALSPRYVKAQLNAHRIRQVASATGAEAEDPTTTVDEPDNEPSTDGSDEGLSAPESP